VVRPSPDLPWWMPQCSTVVEAPRPQTIPHLHDLNEWFLANKLSLIVSKTCFTLFQPHLQNSVQNCLNLELNHSRIEHVSCCKYLGMFLDEKMKWKYHIEYVIKKII